jgi:AraC-like DNA-binding protein
MKHNATETPPFHLIRPYGLNEYLLLLFKSYGEIVVNFKKYDYEPNMFIIMSPKTLHEINTLNNLLVHDYIIFTVDNDELFSKSVALNKLRFHAQAENFSALIKILFQEYLYKSSKSKDLINHLFQTALLYSQTNRISRDAYSRHELQLKKKFDEIRNSFYSKKYFPKKLKEVADLLFLSESRFSHLYTQFYHISPAKDILNFQLQYAKELLELTDFTVSEISKRCGFSNETIFIRAFKRAFQISPGKWR